MTRKPSTPVRTLNIRALLTAALILLVALAALGKGTSDLSAANSIKPVSFSEKATYSSAGWGATEVAVADVDGDGILDLVLASACGDAACHTHGSVAILLGNGDGTFEPAVVYDSGGGFATSIAVADVNGDGKPDVVVANCSDIPSATCRESDRNSIVGVLLGKGDGTFEPAIVYSSGGIRASSVAVADLNGDGKADVLVANDCQSCASGSIGVLLGNGDGTFRTAVTYESGGSGASSLAVEDVNRDGKLDIIATTSDPATGAGLAAVLLGNGDGTFQRAVTYGSGGNKAQAVATADLNGDRKPDLIIANSESNNVGVLLGNGDGTFLPAVTYGSGGMSPASLAVDDVNGDNVPDVVVGTRGISPVGRNVGGISVLLGNRSGILQKAETYLAGGNAAISVALADLESDGRLAILAANCSPVSAGDCSGNGVVSVLLNGSNAQSGAPTTTTITITPNPSNYGDRVTVTATITSSGSTPPTGFVHFGGKIWGTTAFTNGVASSSRSGIYPPGGGVHAHYQQCLYQGPHDLVCGPGGPWAPSMSETEFINVDPAATITTVVSSPNPSVYGEPLILTATAAPASGSGTLGYGGIIYSADGTSLGLTQKGKSLYTKFLFPVGSTTITAHYDGTRPWAPSSGSTTQVVNAVATTTTITSSANPSVQGKGVAFIVKVTSATGVHVKSGTVTLVAGTTLVGTVDVTPEGDARFPTRSLPVGTTAITATYSGATDFLGSSAMLTQTVNP